MGFGETGIGETVRLAKRFEAAGLPEVLIEEAWREPVVQVAAVAAATSRIGLGTGVAQIFPVNPVVSAQQIAQLYELSDGRFIFGIGVGADFVVERWFGVTYRKPLTRMREFVTVLRGVLDSPAAGPFSFEGEFFNIRRYRLRMASEPVPVPIDIAAVGPRMQELAGEVADGVLIGAIHSPAYMEELRERLATGAARSDRDPEQVRIRYFLPCGIGSDTEAGRERARTILSYVSQYPHYRKALAAEGFTSETDAIGDLVRQHRYADARAAVSDEMLARFSICGTAADCREQLRRYEAEYPGSPVLFTMPFGVPESEAVDALELMADDLTPLLLDD